SIPFGTFPKVAEPWPRVLESELGIVPAWRHAGTPNSDATGAFEKVPFPSTTTDPLPTPRCDPWLVPVGASGRLGAFALELVERRDRVFEPAPQRTLVAEVVPHSGTRWQRKLAGRLVARLFVLTLFTLLVVFEVLVVVPVPLRRRRERRRFGSVASAQA